MKHKLKGNIETRRIWLDEKELLPDESQKIMNHSPNGFMWGYGGSGPAQLALAIMLKIKGSADGYQDFKWNIIAKIPKVDFNIEFEL